MEEKYSLKNCKPPYDFVSVNFARRVLQAKGIRSDFCGHARSNDGTYESNVVINHEAFYVLCDLLFNAYKELDKIEKEKPRRLFGRR